MDLACLDDEDISRAAFESLAVDRPYSSAFADELDFVLRMPMRTRSRTRFSMEQEHRNAGVPLYRANKLMGTAHKRKILLTDVMHALRSSCQHWMTYTTLWFRPSRSSAFLRALCEPSAISAFLRFSPTRNDTRFARCPRFASVLWTLT